MLLDRRLLLTTTTLAATASLAGCARPAWLAEPGAADVPVVTDAFGLSTQLAAAAVAAPQVAAMHQAHADALRKLSRKPLAIPAIALAPGPLLPHEQAAVQHFDALAGRAQDGRLARLIAEIAAAIQQRIALGLVA